MGRETYAFLTGLFVVVFGATLVVIAIWLGNYHDERDTYLVSTRQAVSGLNPESTVFYRGVAVGKVAAIQFDPSDVRTILIRIEVRKNAPITRGTWAMLRVQPLTGLAQVELNDSGENTAPLETGGDTPARIPMRPSLFDQVTASGQDILGQLSQLITRLNGLLDGESLAHLRNILATADQAVENLNHALAGLPAVTTDTRRALARIDDVATGLGNAAGQVEKLAGTAQELTASSKLASETLGTATLPQLNTLMQDMQTTSARFRQLATVLERDPQSLLLGAPVVSPGPGEPGYREPSP